MTVSEVRKRYIEFFRARGHAVIPSASLVPENDPTTLFTGSGMQPLVPYLLGEPHPEGKRLVDSQMSFRAGDIEEVGDNRHTTFFEMLGNWSLGDYFKKEQLPWVYEFLTEELKLSKDRLWVTCFAGDEGLGLPKDTESAHIWKEIGVPEDRIYFYDAKKNWWSRSGTPEQMPAGEPGGPDSEIFFDFQTPHDKAFGETCHPNCDCGRFMEIGNSVFMEYLKNADGSFGKLPKQNVDFGGGLERFTAALRDNPDVFLIDVFEEARSVIEEHSQKNYGADEDTTRSYRIVLDHIRAAAFILAGGIVPSNSEQGYVLRRLIRRSIIESRHIGAGEKVFSEIVARYATAYKDTYPHLEEKLTQIQEELHKESEQFGKTLAGAIRKLWGLFYDASKSESEKMNAEILFHYFTSEGFPMDLTLEEYRRYRKEKNLVPLVHGEIELLIGEFKKKMEEHQAKSRAGAAQKFAGGLADHAEQTVRYHTATHLLRQALEDVLQTKILQKGSNITAERLRFDFTFDRKMTDEEKKKVEDVVNEKIALKLPVHKVVMNKEEAEKTAASHVFNAKYGDEVSIYYIGDSLETAYSKEFCGGPHVTNTSELGHFKIVKEEASSAGVRRIKAVLE